jgi:hypothetical protein
MEVQLGEKKYPDKKSDIVLGFFSPTMRAYTAYAVA